MITLDSMIFKEKHFSNTNSTPQKRQPTIHDIITPEEREVIRSYKEKSRARAIFAKSPEEMK